MFSADLLCTFYRSVSTSDIIRLQEIEQRRNQILGIRAQSVGQFLKIINKTLKNETSATFSHFKTYCSIFCLWSNMSKLWLLANQSYANRSLKRILHTKIHAYLHEIIVGIFFLFDNIYISCCLLATLMSSSFVSSLLTTVEN